MLHNKACNCGCRRRRLCTMGRRDHEQPATHIATYSYVTGRAGRTSWASKRICDDHAAAFAKKHGIDLPAEQAETEQAGPAAMKVRLMGTTGECARLAALLALGPPEGPAGVEVLEVQGPYLNRGDSALVRLYLEVRLTPEPAEART
jgi:hypothetical protein